MEPPLPKNTVLGSSPNIGSQIFRLARKVLGFPPWDGPEGGNPALRATYWRQGVRYRGELPENLVKRAGTPILGTFWRFWGISGENGVQSWPPRESKPAEKTAHHSSGVISEVLPRVDFALPVCLGPKSTLGRTAEMTPEGRWCVFSADLDSLEARIAHRFHRKSQQMAKMTQNHLKKGVPPFLHVFYLVPL